MIPQHHYQERKTMKSLLKAALVITALCFSPLAACDDTPNIPITDLQVDTAETGSPVIKGMATNRTGKLVKNIFVNFNLYDANGVVVGNTIASATNLSPGDRWQLRAPSAIRNFTSFKITGINAYY